jgi:hypothetical protein
LLQAGADAVQVGTATFRDPRAPWKVLRQVEQWCEARRTTVDELRSGARSRAHAASGEGASSVEGEVASEEDVVMENGGRNG